MQKTIYLLALVTMLILGCGKDSDVFIPNPGDPLPERVIASVLGVVTDQAGDPVSNANVYLETYHGQTNDLGLFLFHDVQIYEDTYVRVEKPGYFNGSRRFYPIAGNTANVRIQMLSSATVGSFQSSSGGSLDLTGNTRIVFPSNAVATQSGDAYSGAVQVSAVPLYTDDSHLIDKMPGDLVGKNADGKFQALGSFGMIAVELRDGSGSLLQVAEGKKVTIEFAVAPNQLANAPSTIPLWYFDETTGYWKEEGEATLSGNKYIMEVGHFSFWNCDAQFPLIMLTGSVFYDNGEPASGVYVCITVPGLNTSSGGITDGDGVFSGKVPKDQEMILTVKDYNGCNVLDFEMNIGPFSEDVTLDPITITFDDGELVVITGSLVDCDGNPVENGIVEVKFGDATRYVYIEDGNAFTYTFYNCDQEPVTVKGFDYLNSKESLPVTMDHAPEIDYGTIDVCEDLTEYLNVFADGQTISFVLPRILVSGTGTINTSVQGQGIQDSSVYFYVNVPGAETGTFPIGNPNGAEVFLALGFGTWGNITTGTCTFTYFGEPGDFVMGTMEGTYREINNMQQQMEYPFTCEFKILRE